MSDGHQVSSPIPKQKYRLWKYDSSIPIPARTQRNWAKNSIHCAFDFQQREDDVEGLDTTSNITSEDESSAGDENSNEEDSDTVNDRKYVSFCDEEMSDNDSISSDINSDNVNSDNDSNPSNDDGEAQFNVCGDIRSPISLYTNSSITKDEAILDIATWYIEEKISKSALTKLLRIQEKILPKDNVMPKTTYQLFHYIKELAPPCCVTKHHYCKQCKSYMGTDVKIKKCLLCRPKTENIGYFFDLDIEDQVRFLFETRGLADKLQSPDLSRDKNVLSDIIDGSEYVKVNKKIAKQRYDLTLILNLDGLSLIKSSESHCWPILVEIAELPQCLRASFMIIIGHWYDSEMKPPMNLFLRPFIFKLQKCFESGIHWTDKTGTVNVSRIIAPLIIADAPARAQIQNLLNFNGKYGCNICEIRTKRCRPIEGERRTRKYQYEEIIRLRTGKRMEVQAWKVDRERRMQLNKKIVKHRRGVKGYSFISYLPHIDLSTCLVPEYMHSVLLGVVKQFMKIWLQETGPWNISTYQSEIDNFLLTIRPLETFNRLPRKLSFFNLYKASEFYYWSLFYSLPSLVNYLPEKYLQHWILLVTALFNLLKDHINEVDLQQSDKQLNLFVLQIDELYGDRKLTYNTHQLLHLVECVRRWGPLWATAAFDFENFNGFIAKCVHGNKHIGQEIVNHIIVAQGVQMLRSRLAEHYSNTEYQQHKKQFQLMGKCLKMNLNQQERQIISNGDLQLENLKFFARVIINRDLYTSTTYKTTKTNNFTLRLTYHGGIVYGMIKVFFTDSKSLYFLLQRLILDHMNIFHHEQLKVPVEHILPVTELDELLLFKLEDIDSLYHVIRVGNYICKRPNSLTRQVL